MTRGQSCVLLNVSAAKAAHDYGGFYHYGGFYYYGGLHSLRCVLGLRPEMTVCPLRHELDRYTAAFDGWVVAYGRAAYRGAQVMLWC